MIRQRAFLRNPELSQKGQAVTEYVLLLLVTIALVLAMANAIYRPFGDWMKDYMGAYLQCLLDVGELPNLSAVGGEGLCDEDFKPFTIAGGRPPGGQPGSNRGDGQRPQESQSNSNRDSSGGGSVASAGSRNGGARRPDFNYRQRGADGATSLEEQRVVAEAPGATRYFRVVNVDPSGSNVYGRGKRIKAKGVAGLLAREREKLKKRQERVRKVAQIEEGGVLRKAKKHVVTPPKPKPTVDVEIEPWSFGKLFRTFIIIALIVAIVLFIGGQAMQISKSMEK